MPEQRFRSENDQLFEGEKKREKVSVTDKQWIYPVSRIFIVCAEKTPEEKSFYLFFHANLLPTYSTQHQHWENKTIL